MITSIIIGVIVSIFTYSNSTHAPNKKTYLINILISCSAILLLLFLALIGGESQSNVSLSNPMIWILFIGSILYNISKYKEHSKGG